ncbi:hypothetical protein DITRI_Ditri15bG0018300 [Diplodiscus trichospermus]
MRLAIWGMAKWLMVKESVLDVIRFPNIVHVLVVNNHGRSVSCWICPSDGVLKFNVDGSAIRQTGLAGIGGILRDHWSSVKGVFSKSIGVADSNLVEIIAIKEALSLYVSSQWIENLKLQFSNWTIKHILREANELADSLAKSGVHRLISAGQRTSGEIWLVETMGIAVDFRCTADVRHFATMNFHYRNFSFFFFSWVMLVFCVGSILIVFVNCSDAVSSE